MRDYARIATKIRETPWLITAEGLHTVLSIFDDHRIHGHLSDEEIERRLSDARLAAQGNEFQSYDARIEGGVGILPIQGPIFGKANLLTQLSGATSLEMTRQDFRAMVQDERVHTILLNIDSPGGTSDLVAEFGDEIYAARDQKQIISLANTTMGSAAFWLASQAEHVYSTKSGMVGSVGAYTVHEDQSGADAKDGYKYTYIFAGPHKIEGNPHEPLSREAKDYRQEVINSLYGDFVDALARGRGTTAENVKDNYGGGRMLMPTDALEAGMIDGIMSEEALMSSLHSRPQHLSLVIDGKAVAAIMIGNELKLDDVAMEQLLEHVDMEHSEPGTGVPTPAPRPVEQESDVTSGSRRDGTSEVPLDKNDPGAPQAKANGGAMNEEQLNTLFSLYGVDNEDALVEAIKADRTAVAESEKAKALSDEEARLQAEFPNLWEEHVRNREQNQTNKAETFVESVKQIKKPEADRFVDTGFGLSALAMETIKTSHIKFATGVGTLEDFESAIKAVTDGGTVDYRELGSTATNDTDINLNDVVSVRQAFASRVDEIQRANPDMTYDMALSEATKRHPDLAAAYRSAKPVNDVN